MVINKKIKRIMLQHKSQYIGSVILIIIGCMLYSSFTIAMTDVLDTLDAFRTNYTLEDASFIVQNPISNLQELENKYDLALEERKSIDVNYDSKSVLRILQATEKIDRYAVVSGKALAHEAEILVDQGFAKAHLLSVGDNLSINNLAFNASLLLLCRHCFHYRECFRHTFWKLPGQAPCFCCCRLLQPAAAYHRVQL